MANSISSISSQRESPGPEMFLELLGLSDRRSFSPSLSCRSGDGQYSAAEWVWLCVQLELEVVVEVMVLGNGAWSVVVGDGGGPGGPGPHDVGINSISPGLVAQFLRLLFPMISCRVCHSPTIRSFHLWISSSTPDVSPHWIQFRFCKYKKKNRVSTVEKIWQQLAVKNNG